jgi:hypothetical protein
MRWGLTSCYIVSRILGHNPLTLWDSICQVQWLTRIYQIKRLLVVKRKMSPSCSTIDTTTSRGKISTSAILPAQGWALSLSTERIEDRGERCAQLLCSHSHWGGLVGGGLVAHCLRICQVGPCYNKKVIVVWGGGKLWLLSQDVISPVLPGWLQDRMVQSKRHIQDGSRDVKLLSCC